VGEWWRDHRPACARALPGPYAAAAAAAELTSEDRTWVHYVAKRAAEGFGPPHPGGSPSSRARCLDLVKCNSPAAYAVITGTVAEPERREPTAADKRAVADALRGLFRP